MEKIIHGKVDVVRNDQLPLEKAADYDKIILSPGPGIPVEAGDLLPLIKEYAPQKAMLGVCLGHQAIGEVFGGKLKNLSTVYHGVATEVRINNGKTMETSSLRPIHPSRFDLFKGLGSTIEAGRYHSWIIDEEGFPEEIEVTARDENNYIMALQHKSYDLQGVQFHPESVLTPSGEMILRNWLKR